MSFEKDAIDKNTPLIEGRGLGHAFGRNTVLTGIDVSVTAGEIVTLIGPNGAGKTTLVRILMGLINPTSGSVHRRPDLIVGYLPQNFQIDPVLPINVRRLLCLTGAPSEEDMIASLKEVGAAHVMDEPVHTLSGGELQRVLLARALLRNPDLLVLDEPIAGIDVGGQIELYGLITKIRTARNCGVLMISHDLHLVMSATDRVMCINQHVCCSGQPETVSQHPEYIALFGPQAAKSLAVYTHAHDHEHDLSGDVVPHDHEHHDHAHDHSHEKDTESD